eukprot:231646-Prymnesium_polylepis.1
MPRAVVRHVRVARTSPTAPRVAWVLAARAAQTEPVSARHRGLDTMSASCERPRTRGGGRGRAAPHLPRATARCPPERRKAPSVQRGLLLPAMHLALPFDRPRRDPADPLAEPQHRQQPLQRTGRRGD